MSDLPRGEEPEIATFAGGCFWCIESGFAGVPGVIEAVSGYTGGTKEGPSLPGCLLR